LQLSEQEIDEAGDSTEVQRPSNDSVDHTNNVCVENNVSRDSQSINKPRNVSTGITQCVDTTIESIEDFNKGNIARILLLTCNSVDKSPEANISDILVQVPTCELNQSDREIIIHDSAVQTVEIKNQLAHFPEYPEQRQEVSECVKGEIEPVLQLNVNDDDMNCMRGSSKQLGRDARISFDLRMVKILSESSDCTNESVDDINNLIEPEQVTHNSVDRVWIWNKSDPLDRSIEMVESVENSCKLGDKVDVSVDGGKRFYKPKVYTPGNKLTGSVDCFQILNNFTHPVAQAIVSVELCDTVKQSIDTVDNVKQSIETVDNLKQSIETVDNVKQSIESVDNVKQSIDTVDNVNFLCKLVKQSEETVDQEPFSPCLQETGEQLYKIYDNDLKCLQETSKKSGEMFNFGTSWNKDEKVTVDGNRSSESVKQSAEETDGLKFLHETSKKHGKPGVKYWSDFRNQSNKAFVIGQIQCDIEMPTGKTVDDTTRWSPVIRIGETDCETFLGKNGTMLFEPASSELFFPGPLDKREYAVDCGTFLSDFINEGSEMNDILNVTKSGEQPYVVVDVWPNCEPDASPYKNVYIFPNRFESGQVGLVGQSSEQVLFDSVEDNVVNRDKDKVNTEFDQSNMDIR